MGAEPTHTESAGLTRISMASKIAKMGVNKISVIKLMVDCR